MNYFEKYKDCLLYIDSYWDKIIHKPTKKQINDNVIHIPFCYITPNDKKFNFIYYWDTFFMFRGLMGTKREWVIKDMVDNFTYLLDRYHIIPNFNSYASTGRSQPPFFSSMILDTYYTSLHSDNFWKKPIYFFGKMLGKSIVNKTWLKRAIQRAKREYELVWMDPANLYHHRVDGYGLSRYGDRDIGYAHTSEL
ncbi:MAG: hypothetical protein HYT10_00385, partial [Candidatus Levybacteria bacterium]|nr:hypothetical protein [Candidatus Levybacteria bacterium]